MKLSDYNTNMMPEYGPGYPVEPAEKGNIDIAANNYAKTYVELSNDSTLLYGESGLFSIIPKISPSGNLMGNSEAIRLYKKTNGHLGRFYTKKDATEYQQWLLTRAKEISEYFPDENIVDVSGSKVVSPKEQARIEMNKSLYASNIRQAISVSKKGLGRTIRRFGEVFDPNAIDGDMDGIVQDGTMWARPALPGKPSIAAMRSIGTGRKFTSDDTKTAAAKVVSMAKKEEPRLTKKIKEIENLSDGKAKLVDLDKRFKSADSIAQKIERLKGNWNNDIAETATQVNDPLRYSFVVNNDKDYSSFVASSIGLLQSEGVKVTSWNYWKSKDPYSGVNIMVEHPNGFNYEVQFHTKKSHSLKGKLEPLYDNFREEADPDARQKIYDKMQSLSSGITVPDGADRIGEATKNGYQVATFNPQMLLASTGNRSSRRAGVDAVPPLPPKRKLGKFFPTQEEIIPMQPSEKRRLEAVADKWMLALYSIATGQRMTGYDGELRKKPMVLGYSVKGTGQYLSAEEMQQEVIDAILERVIEMRTRNDYNFLNWVPAYAGGGIDWWNSVRREHGLPEISEIGDNPVGLVYGEKDKRKGRPVEGSFQELLKRAYFNIAARRDKTSNRERSTQPGGNKDSDGDRVAELGSVDVDFDRGLEQVDDYDIDTDSGIVESNAFASEVDVDTPTVDAPKSSKPARFSPEMVRKQSIPEVLDNLEKQLEDSPETVAGLRQLHEVSPKLFEMFVDRYLRELTEDEFSQKWESITTDRVVAALYPKIVKRDAEGRDYTTRSNGDSFMRASNGLGGVIGGRDSSFTDLPISEWHKELEKIADAYIAEGNFDKLQKRFGISAMGMALLKPDLKDIAERRAGKALGRAKSSKASPEDVAKLAGLLGALYGQGAGRLDIYNAIAEYMGRPLFDKGTMGNAKKIIAKYLGMTIQELDGWLASLAQGKMAMPDSYHTKRSNGQEMVLTKRLFISDRIRP